MQQTAENPFDYAFAQWALDFKPQIRQHLISGASGADTRPREPPGSRLQAAQGMTEAQQLQEATTVIEKLERCAAGSHEAQLLSELRSDPLGLRD